MPGTSIRRHAMSIANVERKAFGDPLTPTERLVAGIVTVIGAAGNILLGLVGVWLLYALVVAL